ncbi:MAG TPA: hypothetical protein VK796_07230, partial [Cytophaga sp.]|nr:hypothetical protein [Cytophaga sp.]
MDIAILESKVKSKSLRLITTITLIVATIALPAILLNFSDRKTLMFVQGASTVLLFIILIKIINGYKVVGIIELNNDHWIINKQDFK